MAEDEAIVKGDVDDGFGEGAEDEELALIGADQQRVAHLVDIEAGEAPDAEAQKGDGLLAKRG